MGAESRGVHAPAARGPQRPAKWRVERLPACPGAAQILPFLTIDNH